MQEAIGEWKPEAAVISNPTSYHVEFALQAAREGLHLLIEKPLSDNLEGVTDLRKAVQKSKVQVLIGYQYRFHTALQTIREMLIGDQIGKVLVARAHYGEYLPDWHPWEDYRDSYAARASLGGGALLTLSHPLDYVTWLLGDVQSVSAEVMKIGEWDMDVEDTAEVNLVFASGALGVVHLNYTQRPRRHDLEIIGSSGTLRWSEYDSFVLHWKVGVDDWNRIPVENATDRNWMFQEEMRHFIQLANGHGESNCSLESGIGVLNIALAAHKSAQTGMRVTP
jgi:predicted dehydrogenase